MPDEFASEAGMPRNSARIRGTPDLLVVERMLRRSAQARWLISSVDAVVSALHARRDRRGLLDGEAEPVHAGVDMQRGAAVPVAGR